MKIEGQEGGWQVTATEYQEGVQWLGNVELWNGSGCLSFQTRETCPDCDAADRDVLERMVEAEDFRPALDYPIHRLTETSPIGRPAG